MIKKMIKIKNKNLFTQSLSTLAAAISISCFSVHSNANNLDLALSDQTIKIGLISGTRADTRSSFEANFFHNEGESNMAALGLHVASQNKPLRFLLGVKTYYVDFDNVENDEEGSGIVLGGKAIYAIMPKFTFSAQAYYSPAVTSFGDTEHYKEGEVRLNLQLVPGGDVFLGYRNIDVDIEDVGDLTLHEGGFAGASFVF
jgi:hypothetical protein